MKECNNLKIDQLLESFNKNYNEWKDGFKKKKLMEELEITHTRAEIIMAWLEGRGFIKCTNNHSQKCWVQWKNKGK